jgi:hypothetical protein
MTTKFESAAALMARVLGADGYPFVTIDHPMSSATPEGLSESARMAISEGAAILAGLAGSATN